MEIFVLDRFLKRDVWDFFPVGTYIDVCLKSWKAKRLLSHEKNVKKL